MAVSLPITNLLNLAFTSWKGNILEYDRPAYYTAVSFSIFTTNAAAVNLRIMGNVPSRSNLDLASGVPLLCQPTASFHVPFMAPP